MRYYRNKYLRGLFISALACALVFSVFGSVERLLAQEEDVAAEETVVEEGPTPEELATIAEIENLKRELEAREAEARELEAQAKELSEKIGATQEEKRTLNNQIAILNGQIKKLNVDIQLNENKIQSTTIKLNRLDLLIGRRTSEIEQRKGHLVEAVRLINEYDQKGLLEVMLANASIANFLDQIAYIEQLQGSLSANLQELKALKVQLLSERAETESLKESLEDLKDQLGDRKDLAAGRKSYQSYLLQQTKNQEKQFQKLLTDVEKKEQEIAQEIFEIEEKLRVLVDPESIPASGKLFIWPAKGRFTQKYGPTSQTGFINDFYKFHNGVDVANTYGTEIRAAADGTVIGVGDNSNYAYGRWVAIDHGNNLITLYAHMSKMRVNAGFTVHQGDVIGYMGSTGFSTGSHVHFSVYAKNTFKMEDRWFGLLPIGGTVDPMRYLDLGDLQK